MVRGARGAGGQDGRADGHHHARGPSRDLPPGGDPQHPHAAPRAAVVRGLQGQPAPAAAVLHPHLVQAIDEQAG